MATVTVKVLGGEGTSEQEVGTVGELKAALGLSNHSAKVNNSSASDDTELSDGDFVAFATSVKGGI